MRDQRDHDRGDSTQHALDRRKPAPAHIGPGAEKHHRDGRQDEAGPGDQQTAPSCPAEADVQRHLRGIGAWDQIGRSDEVEKLGGGEPPSFLDDLPLHQGQMSGRSAEAEAAKLEKESGERSDVGADSLAHRFRLREARKSRSV